MGKTEDCLMKKVLSLIIVVVMMASSLLFVGCARLPDGYFRDYEGAIFPIRYIGDGGGANFGISSQFSELNSWR